MRRDERDYISPICYVGLMEFLGFMASSYLLQKGCVYCTKSLLVNMLECRTSKFYLDTCLASNSNPDYDLDRLAFSSGRFIFEAIMTLLTEKDMLWEWIQRTSSPSSYSEVLWRLVVTLYPLILTHELVFKKGTLTHDLQNCYDLTSTLQRCRVFVDLPLEFSEKMVRALQIRPRTPSNFTRVLADALDAVGDRMVVIVGSRKARAVCPNLNAYMISKEELYDVPKIMALLWSEEPSCVKQQAALPEKSDGTENIPRAVQDNMAESTSEINVSDETAPFWDMFERFQVNKQGQKDARFIVQFLRSAVPWLEQTGFKEKIDVQLLEEVRHIYGQFEERSARMEKTACLTLEDLYSMWQDGENKLQMIISFLCSQRAYEKEDGRTNEVQSQTDEWTGCSDERDRCPVTDRRRRRMDWMLGQRAGMGEGGGSGGTEGGSDEEEQEAQRTAQWLFQEVSAKLLKPAHGRGLVLLGCMYVLPLFLSISLSRDCIIEVHTNVYRHILEWIYSYCFECSPLLKSMPKKT